jgi:UDP-N-acetylglucosamine acyltransferase
MIHPTAIIHKKARVDSTAEIGPYAVIDEHVQVGPKCRIGPHVHLTGHLTLGEGNVVHAHAVLGDLPQDLAYEPCESFLKIGNHNTIREMVTMHRGTKPGSETVVGDHNFFMATSHVAHNCRVGNHVILSNCALAAGYVELQDHVIVSGGVVLHQFIRVGRLAILRGQSRYSKDVPPFCVGDGTNGVVGLNVVGLRRAGLGPDARKQLKRAFHAVFLAGQAPLDAIKSYDGEPTREVNELFGFIESSKRGVCFPKGDEQEGDEEPDAT